MVRHRRGSPRAHHQPGEPKYSFTNEGGVAGTFRFSKNVAGLWLVQECRRTWAAQGEELSYAALTDLAAGAPPLVSLVDPDDPEFSKPGDMPARIRAFCRRTGQPVPESKAAVVRCALESLALKYRWVLEKLEDTPGASWSRCTSWRGNAEPPAEPVCR